MREFFRGWKRKVGCVTLALACVFMAGWMRSELICDRITTSSRTFVELGHGSIAVSYVTSTAIDEWEFPLWEPDELDQLASDMRNVEWQWQILGFGHGHPAVIEAMSIWTFPYWSIALPLTLLSAYLLLSRHRAPSKLPVSHA